MKDVKRYDNNPAITEADRNDLRRRAARATPRPAIYATIGVLADHLLALLDMADRCEELEAKLGGCTTVTLTTAIRTRIDELKRSTQDYHGRGMQRQASQAYGGTLELERVLREVGGG